jgi:HEAT repeat protein
MTSEVDPVVWQQVLRATQSDARQAAEQLAYLAIGHASADVRRLACEYLVEHAAPRHAAVLVPMLKDPNSSVLVAAVRAIGQGKSIDDPRPLVELLLTPDRLVRAEAALALAHLQVAEGAAAIERLALETDIHVRQRIATGLGELKNPSFVPTLILMLDDRPEVQRLAIRSLTQIVGSDVGAGESSKPAPLDQQIERWRRWHEAQQSLRQQG